MAVEPVVKLTVQMVRQDLTLFLPRLRQKAAGLDHTLARVERVDLAAVVDTVTAQVDRLQVGKVMRAAKGLAVQLIIPVAVVAVLVRLALILQVQTAVPVATD